MKYAIYMPLYSPFGSPRIIADLAREAEQAGWDGVFVWDDVAGWDTDMADPWISLAAAAMVTQRVRLGALITPLARRRPWKFARETASLDHLSGGRLVVGVGLGEGPEQFDNLGEQADRRVRGDMLDEGLEVVAGLWSGEAYQFEGQHYSIKRTIFRPKPVQQPRIPVWVAGVWPHMRPRKRMARWDGMFPLFWGVKDISEQQANLRQMLASVLALRQEIYPDHEARPFDVVVGGETPPDQPDQSEAHIAGFADAGATWWLEALAPERTGAPERGGGPAWSFTQLRERVLAGPLGGK